MKNKQLTISVAAYNVEAYLDNLMRSIIKADIMDLLEILIINDGSKDQTSAIAKKYQDKYPQSVRLIDKPNGGHGSTINTGIQEASGKYFRALDGDDWIDSENLSKLAKKLNDIDSDIILSEYCMCYENGQRIIPNEFTELKDGEQYLFNNIWHPSFYMRYHTAIYRTSILKEHNISLDEHCFYVDTEFMLYPIPYINSIYFFKDYIYCYRIGYDGQSVSNQSRMKNISHSEKVAKHLIEYYNKHKKELSQEKNQYFIENIAFHCKWHEESIFCFPASKQKKDELFKFESYIHENAPEIYNKMGEKSKILRIMRKTKYSTYRLVSVYKKTKKQ